MAGIGGVIGGIFGRMAAKAVARGMTKAALAAATRSLAKGAAREVGRAALNAGPDTLFGQYGVGRSKRRRRRKAQKHPEARGIRRSRPKTRSRRSKTRRGNS